MGRLKNEPWEAEDEAMAR